MNRRPLRFAAAAYAIGVLWLTIGPAPWSSTEGHELDGGIVNLDAWTSPATWSTGYISEIAFNVMLFIPVGLLAALLIPRRRWPLALLAGFGFTAFIELGQLVLPDRVSDPRDLLLNTLGATVGVGLVLASRGVRRATAVISVAPASHMSTSHPTSTSSSSFPPTGPAVDTQPTAADPAHAGELVPANEHVA
ncbi:VanZ family protein [Agromyces salentinus]|uniref:VanZ-like domain-containing protein n=1 Tax=Agromyces salentinus TaxID=269421 RepID=A0ABN2ML16_9MICO|nr:VanZ family protein [Agromyces salentinus]